MLRVSLIGFGRTGTHLFYSLKKAQGIKVSVAMKEAGSKTDLKSLAASDVIFICTGDKNIKAASENLLELPVSLKNKIIFHTSGAKSSDELNILKNSGALAGSFHPVQTFENKAKKYSGIFKNIYVVLEGETKAVTAGRKITLAVQAKPLVISKQDKVLHHICCVFSSNYLVALMKQAEGIFTKNIAKKIHKNGFKNINFFDIYKPLIAQTLQNMAKKGTISALTGPIERNDTDTVEHHLKSLKKQAPRFLTFYVFMGIETVKTALIKKSLNNENALKILKLLNKYGDIAKA